MPYLDIKITCKTKVNYIVLSNLMIVRRPIEQFKRCVNVYMCGRMGTLTYTEL